MFEGLSFQIIEMSIVVVFLFVRKCIFLLRNFYHFIMLEDDRLLQFGIAEIEEIINDIFLNAFEYIL
jgi:hypothetical protein